MLSYNSTPYTEGSNYTELYAQLMSGSLASPTKLHGVPKPPICRGLARASLYSVLLHYRCHVKHFDKATDDT